VSLSLEINPTRGVEKGVACETNDFRDLVVKTNKLRPSYLLISVDALNTLLFFFNDIHSRQKKDN